MTNYNTSVHGTDVVRIGTDEVSECVFCGVFDGVDDIQCAVNNGGENDDGLDDVTDVGADGNFGADKRSGERVDEDSADFYCSEEVHPALNSILESSFPK